MSKICCFAGHRIGIDDSVKVRLYENIAYLVDRYDVRQFRVGNYGEFDRYASDAVSELKTKYPDITLELVLPYLTKEIKDYKEIYYKKYDSILIANIPEKTPKRYHIIKTNEFMINNADYLICYVSHSGGGAARTLEYAKRKKHIHIINLNQK